MKLNIKARLENKVFVLSATALIVTFIYQLMSALDIVPAISESEASELTAMLVNILALFGVVVDPTTEGISDSNRAMTYCTEYDIRNIEVDCNE